MDNSNADQVVGLGYGPDSVDAFKYFALREKKISTEPVRYTFRVEDHHLLNERADNGDLEVSALSLHAYAYVQDKYNLLSCGATVGDGYGPLLVGRYGLSKQELADARLAIPGDRTTAHLALQLYAGSRIDARVVPPDGMLRRILDGEFDAGLIIHEDLQTYDESDVTRVVDLGAWWKEETGLPLPTAGVAVRRDVENPERIGAHLKQSIQYGLDRPDEALKYAADRADQLTDQQLREYVERYVNDFSLDYGKRGRKAVHTLLNRSYEQGLIEDPVSPVFIQVP